MSEPSIPLIRDPDEVRRVAARVADAGSMAFDVEFASDGRYIPEPSLVQVAWPAALKAGEPEIAVIDCLAVDPGPVLALVGDQAVATVAHAARQDLGLLAMCFGVRARSLWDTQIAAAFLGLGEQVGYAKLVRALCRVEVAKDASYAAWLERPLSPAQLRYAAEDVRHLPRVWAHLRARLEDRGRLAWVREESEALAGATLTPGPADQAYLSVKGRSGLTGRALVRLRVLAAWRQETALAENRPLGWILPDKVMLAACRRPPRNARELRTGSGLSGAAARRYGDAILAALARAERAELTKADEAPQAAALGARGKVWADVILALLQDRAVELELAARLLGTRAEVEAAAVWFEQHGADGGDSLPDQPLFTGWRHELVGASIAAWLRGRADLICTPAGPGALALVARSTAGAD